MNSKTLSSPTGSLPVHLALTGSSTPVGDTQRVELLARANTPFFHWGFDAYLLHDFSTMNHKEQIAIDWEHGDIIGKSLAITTAADGLHITAELTAHNETSREVIAMLRAGVPLEASISFRDFDVEYFTGAGVTVVVNGQSVPVPADGDLCVIKNWHLSSCAICKEGYDPQTETDMLSFLKAKKAALSTAEEPAATEAPASNDRSEEATTAATAADTEAKDAEEPAPETAAPAAPDTPETAALPGDTELSVARKVVEQFVAAFGEQAAVKYLAAGLDFSAAKDQALTDLRTERDALAQELSAAKAASATPVPFTPAEAPATYPKINGLTAAQSKLCALIKRD